MSVPSQIVGCSTNKCADVVNQNTDNVVPGVVVYNEELTKYENNILPFTSDIFGVNLNVNSGFVAGGANIYDGGDNSGWSPSVLSGVAGSFVFSDTEQAYDGIYSFSTLAAVGGNSMLITAPSPIEISGFNSFSGAVLVNDWSTVGTREITFVFRLNGVPQSATVNLSEYINSQLFNVWQGFSIPLHVLNIQAETVDELVVSMVANGAAPGVYFDVFSFQVSPDTAVYNLKPQKGERIVVNGFTFIFADEYDSSLVNGTVPNISYDKFLGVDALTNGITIRRIQKAETRFNATFRSLFDILELPNSSIRDVLYDGTNTFLKVEFIFNEGVILDGTYNDRYELSFNEDLSGLKEFRINANTKIIKKFSEIYK